MGLASATPDTLLWEEDGGQAAGVDDRCQGSTLTLVPIPFREPSSESPEGLLIGGRQLRPPVEIGLQDDGPRHPKRVPADVVSDLHLLTSIEREADAGEIHLEQPTYIRHRRRRTMDEILIAQAHGPCWSGLPHHPTALDVRRDPSGGNTSSGPSRLIPWDPSFNVTRSRPGSGQDDRTAIADEMDDPDVDAPVQQQREASYGGFRGVDDNVSSAHITDRLVKSRGQTCVLLELPRTASVLKEQPRPHRA